MDTHSAVMVFNHVMVQELKQKISHQSLKAAVEAGNDNFEIGGGARFQSLCISTVKKMHLI